MPRTRKIPKTRTCPNCNKVFSVRTKNPRTKYCCHPCSVEHVLRGKRISEEHRLNIKLHHSHYWLGKKHTPEQIKKETVGLKKYQSGKYHWNWKGGITPLLKRLRFVKKYKLWRDSVFKRDDYICQTCHQRGNRLNADHIVSFAKLVYEKRWDDLWDTDNGRTLCVDCHRKTDSYARRFAC